MRQTRIFFKLENAQSLLNQNTNYVAPLHPYRDFAIRFGLVWNFFL
ncbi:putative porin [Mesonia aquimarina]